MMTLMQIVVRLQKMKFLMIQNLAAKFSWGHLNLGQRQMYMTIFFTRKQERLYGQMWKLVCKYSKAVEWLDSILNNFVNKTIV